MTALQPSPHPNPLSPRGARPLAAESRSASAPERVRDQRARRAREREPVIDMVRLGALLTVVLLHALMIGAWTLPDGTLGHEVALTGTPGFAAATWLLQVMPLFFIAGGHAGLLAWRRARDRGQGPAEHAARRVVRLLRPAALMLLVVGAILLIGAGALADVGSSALLDEAELRIRQPLWFLLVYLGISVLLPHLARCWERLPSALPVALGVAIVLVDALAVGTGEPLWGCLNLALVWPFATTLGFLHAAGAAGDWRPSRLALAAAAPLGAMAVLAATGLRSPDLLVNLNPPTVMIALLGIAQFFLLRLVEPHLRRWGVRPGIAGLVARGNGSAMTIYLWHMPVLLGLVAIAHGMGIVFPEPATPLWWLTRPILLIAAALALLPVLRALRGVEAAAPAMGPPSAPLAVLAWLAASAAIGLALLWGFGSGLQLLLVLACAAVAVLAVRGGTRPRRRLRMMVTS